MVALESRCRLVRIGGRGWYGKWRIVGRDLPYRRSSREYRLGIMMEIVGGTYGGVYVVEVLCIFAKEGVSNPQGVVHTILFRRRGRAERLGCDSLVNLGHRRMIELSKSVVKSWMK